MGRPYEDIPPEALGTLPANTRRIDVREPVEFDGPLGHLPDSELVPMALAEAAARAWPKDEPLLLICRSGGRSARVALMLSGQGFQRLYNLAGGMAAVRSAETGS